MKLPVYFPMPLHFPLSVHSDPRLHQSIFTTICKDRLYSNVNMYDDIKEAMNYEEMEQAAYDLLDMERDNETTSTD